MKTTHTDNIACALQDVPLGKLSIQTHFVNERQTPLTSAEIRTMADGCGKINIFSVYAGIDIAFNHYHATTMQVQHADLSGILEINYCHSGRIGWAMRDGLAVYLGSGDLGIQTMYWCADSQISLPLGYYEGITVFIDIEQLAEHLPPALRDMNISPAELRARLTSLSQPRSISGNKRLQEIFMILYELPTELRIPYYRLKVQELLLWLISVDWSSEPQLNYYQSEQVQTIKEIHTQLTQNLSTRFTIQDLAKQYLLNTTTLKNVFKSVYGQPIASYMRCYRLQYSAARLRDTTDSIALIANQAGYHTQSKFTAAFKEEFQMLPTQYRKLYQQ